VSTFSGAITMNEPVTVTQVANTGSNALNFTGGVTNVGTNTLTFNNVGNVIVSTAGIGGGTLSVVQSGAGTTSFSVANTYSGNTTVNAGTIALTGSAGSLGTGSVNLGASGTLDISGLTGGTGNTLGIGQILFGSGTIKAGTNTLVLNGPLYVDTASPTTLTVATGSLTLGSTSSSHFNVATLTSYNQLIISSGLLTYGGVLGIDFATQTGFGTYNLFTSTTQAGDFTAVTITGTYAATLTDNSGVWSGDDNINGVAFNFNDSTGQLVLSAVPEPAVYGLVLGGAALLLGARRRKKLFLSNSPQTNDPHDSDTPFSSNFSEVP
jgi:autotransporter-associated beta strand protein